MTHALVLLAEGVEEMEAVIAIDVLRRCGVDVIIAATGSTTEVTASRGVRLLADTRLSEVRADDFDALVIPGGAGGSRRLANDPQVLDLTRQFVQANKLLAAVCAGPTVLHAAGLLQGKRITCHPAVRDQFPGVEVLTDRVVIDGNLITTKDSTLSPSTSPTIITSQGPATCFAWALVIATHLVGKEVADKVAEGLIMPPLE